MTSTIHVGDCRTILPTLPERSVQTCVTSPPYFGLRDYGTDQQIGLEPTPDDFVQALVTVFREVRRVLRDDGTAWLNLGDSYASSPPGIKTGDRYATSTLTGPAPGLARDGRLASETADKLDTTRLPGIKPKDLIGIPWMVAFALRADGWHLRADVIWNKPNAMPESVTDRPTKAHEYLFLLSKTPRYFYDADAIREPHTSSAEVVPWQAREHDQSMLAHRQANGVKGRLRGVAGFGEAGRNKRSVWTVATQPYADAHFATFPPRLIEPCIQAGTPRGATVLDPFAGTGTTGVVAAQHGRHFTGIELNPEYANMARTRIQLEGRPGGKPAHHQPAPDHPSLFDHA